MTLVRANEINEAFPDIRWPYSADGTHRLARLGKLGRVQCGRDTFFTRELLEAFIREHITTDPKPVNPKRSASAKKAAAKRVRP